MAPGGELDIEFFVESGRGYQPAQWPDGQSLLEDDRIYIDAMFAPVRKVTFDVEKTRVGGNIDYDKLNLEIHTDGSENPLKLCIMRFQYCELNLNIFLQAQKYRLMRSLALPEVERAKKPANL